MAKTPEQKVANKDASLLKKAAHSARHREISEAENAAQIKASNTIFAHEYEAAQAVEEETRKLRERLISEIKEQISLLDEQIKEIRVKYDLQIDGLAVLRRLAAEKKFTESRRLLKEAQAGFPDMELSDSRFSSVAWIPPDGYIERFAAEHADELAQKKAKREAKASLITPK